jgi:hypothetical protein
LITEDWNAAIGLEAVWDDGAKVLVKESSTAGMVIIQDPKKLLVVQSPFLHHFMDTQLGRAVSEAVVTDPDLPNFGGDVWHYYLPGYLGDQCGQCSVPAAP